mmetsp:Transcript_10049/g.35658  ORF Transcript_10049/g.35658 Transcript_10049/m.35658 type:complete len:506 (-) Transcript_10049:89-1606(-)
MGTVTTRSGATPVPRCQNRVSVRALRRRWRTLRPRFWACLSSWRVWRAGRLRLQRGRSSPCWRSCPPHEGGNKLVRGFDRDIATAILFCILSGTSINEVVESWGWRQVRDRLLLRVGVCKAEPAPRPSRVLHLGLDLVHSLMNRGGLHAEPSSPEEVRLAALHHLLDVIQEHLTRGELGVGLRRRLWRLCGRGQRESPETGSPLRRAISVRRCPVGAHPRGSRGGLRAAAPGGLVGRGHRNGDTPLLPLLLLRPLGHVEAVVLRADPRHLLLGEALRLLADLVQVQAVRVVARLVLEEGVAVLGGAKARLDGVPVHDAPVQLLDADHSVRFALEGDVRAACAAPAASIPPIGPAPVDGYLLDLPIPTEELLPSQGVLLAVLQGDPDGVHQVPLDHPDVLQMLSRHAVPWLVPAPVLRLLFSLLLLLLCQLGGIHLTLRDPLLVILSPAVGTAAHSVVLRGVLHDPVPAPQAHPIVTSFAKLDVLVRDVELLQAQRAHVFLLLHGC